MLDTQQKQRSVQHLVSTSTVHQCCVDVSTKDETVLSTDTVQHTVHHQYSTCTRTSKWKHAWVAGELLHWIFWKSELERRACFVRAPCTREHVRPREHFVAGEVRHHSHKTLSHQRIRHCMRDRALTVTPCNVELGCLCWCWSVYIGGQLVITRNIFSFSLFIMQSERLFVLPLHNLLCAALSTAQPVTKDHHD